MVERSPNSQFLAGAARAFAGALIFSLPMLMTMEMWWLGFYMDRLRLALLLLATFPLLVALSHYIGFEPTFDWKDDVIDALVALVIAFLAAAAILALFGVVGPGMTPAEIVGKIALQTVPGAIGALLAFSQLGEHQEAEERQENTGAHYPRELFFMLLGALFLSLNVAPTEEMVLISFMMNAWHTLGLILLSLAIMHGFGASLVAAGRSALPRGTAWPVVFQRFTAVGYAIALLASLVSLWLFGRFEGTDFDQIVKAGAVLAFPASVGASAARMLL